jgi:hypothetical protein
MRRAFLPTLLLGLVLVLQVPARSTDAPGGDDLAGLLKTGLLLQDRNGDGAVDFVDAALVLGEAPANAEIVAAANVAARLGLETTAMNLPLARDPGKAGVVIAIGAGGVARANVSAADAGLAGLQPGEGVVGVAAVDLKPVVVVAGPDASGTLAAAELFAGRLPYAWDLRGPNLEKIKTELRDFLSGSGAAAEELRIASLQVKSGGGLLRLVARARFASAAELGKARAALQALARRKDEKPALSYKGVETVRLELAAAGSPNAAVDVPTAAKPDPPGPIARRPANAKENLDLSTLYAIDGGLGDSDNNLIPDRTDVVLSPNGEGVDATIDLAARIGIESTGIAVPLVMPADAIDATVPAGEAAADRAADTSLSRPESLPTLVLIGTTHPVVERLIQQKKLERPQLQPGEGLIQVVRGAFGQPGQEKRAVIVTGGDARGVARALAQFAERFPHVHQRGKDRTTIEGIEEDVRRFVSGRSSAGQAATALYKLERLLQELQGKDLESAHVKLAVEKAPAGLAALVRQEVGSRLGTARLDVTVENLDVQKASPVVIDGKPASEEFDIPSEVDDFWKLLRGKVVPAVRKAKGKPVRVEARLSEAPELRARIADEAKAELLRAGAPEAATEVVVLSAYKQGYSWLYDVVRPAIAGKQIERITLRFAEIGPPPQWKHQTSFAPTRWLLEAYPFDEVLAKELKLDLKQFTFEKMPIGSPAYEVVVAGPGGAPLFRQSFEPKLVLRPFFDQFPEYEKARVTTGWINASVAERICADERIVTDPERFWDHFQARTLPALYEHVMRVGRGKPRPEDAPFFGELRVELTLSEPDYQIGVDQELIAPMEAIHEEIYFNTLHFFDVLGRHTRGAPLQYVGRVLPWVQAKADGKPGHARISITGFEAQRPGVAIEYKERSGRAGVARLDVVDVALERPAALAALVRDGRDGIERLDVRVRVDTEKDERAELIKRASEERVDRTILSGEQVRAMVANLSRLRAAGMYEDALAYHDLGSLRLVVGWAHESRPGSEALAALEPNGAPAPWPDIKKLLPVGYRHAGGPMVQWDTPIPPPEAYELLAKMSTFPEATVYKVGESYLGRDIWAMDLMPPVAASHWSQAKATTVKPTVVYSARQHANEISSTSHVLKLAELLLTDPEYKEKLKKVNVVIHPITNPDGAQLAYDMQKATPNYMLHAGYLGSLGVDMTAAQNDPDPMYPETLVRPALWRSWLPDIFLNPHGYPHHEWVQLFSEYAAWVRTRAVETRDYWSMRGWWTPGFQWLDDPRYPRHKEDQFKIRSRIVANVKAAPEVVALNERAYDRYARYTFAFDQKNFKLDFTDGVLMYTAIKGARAQREGGPAGGGGGGGFMSRYPNVTIWEGVTEAPDETARGDWLKLVATAGLQWDKASLQHLVEGHHVVDRRAEAFWGGVSLSMNRPRPPRPQRREAAPAAEAGARQ